MSQFNEGNSKGYVANVAIVEGVCVKLSSGKAVISTAATDKIIGVTQDAGAAGETVTVKLRSGAGTVKVLLGTGGCAVGDRLTSDANGKLITTTTAANEVVGVALEAGAAGDFVEAMPSLTLYAIT